MGTRVRHRPPRVFVKGGKIYVRIGKKKYLLKDQKKYSRAELIDIILKNLLVRRKRRERGKLTKREKKLNLQDMKTFEAFEKLNRGRSRNLVLPAGLDKSLPNTSTEQSFFNALVKFSGKIPEDINVVNRAPFLSSTSASTSASTSLVPAASTPTPTPTTPTPPLLLQDLPDKKDSKYNSRYARIKTRIIDEFSKPVRKRDKTAALKKLIADEAIPVTSSNPTGGTKSTEKLARDIIDYYENAGIGQNLVPVFNTYFPNGINVPPTSGPPTAPTAPASPKIIIPPPSMIRPPPPMIGPPSGGPPPPPPMIGPPGMIGPPPPPGMIAPPPVAQVPAPLAEFSFTADSEMKKPEKAEYESVKKSTIAKFKSSQLVAKKKLLQKLIADNKLPLDIDRHKIIASGLKKGQRVFDGAKSAEDLALEIFEYYERTDSRSAIPAVFNSVFPEGVNAVKAPPAKKPAKKKPAPPSGLSHEEELAASLEKRRNAVAAKEQKDDDDASLQSKETTQQRLDREREEAGQAILAATKLKRLPSSITTDDPTKLVDPDDAPALEEIDQSAAGVIVRSLANKKQGKPLSTDEIDNMMHGVRGYIGTYPADFLKFMPKRLPKIFSFVMNTDPSTKPGKHWVAIRVDTLGENVVEYYDSFAEEPSKRFMKQLKKLINTLDVPVYLKLKINKIKEQNTSTNSCGWFAMSFILNRNSGMPFRECTGYDDSVAGEQDIDKMKAKFGYV